jgi:hypothetical protein
VPERSSALAFTPQRMPRRHHTQSKTLKTKAGRQAHRRMRTASAERSSAPASSSSAAISGGGGPIMASASAAASSARICAGLQVAGSAYT